MNYKRILGILLILAGIGLYFYCQHGRERMISAHQQIDDAHSLIPSNPVTDPIEEGIKQDLHRRVDKYKEPIRLCFVGSGILIIGGFFFIIFGKSKKTRK